MCTGARPKAARQGARGGRHACRGTASRRRLWGLHGTASGHHATSSPARAFQSRAPTPQRHPGPGASVVQGDTGKGPCKAPSETPSQTRDSGARPRHRQRLCLTVTPRVCDPGAYPQPSAQRERPAEEQTQARPQGQSRDRRPRCLPATCSPDSPSATPPGAPRDSHPSLAEGGAGPHAGAGLRQAPWTA